MTTFIPFGSHQRVIVALLVLLCPLCSWSQYFRNLGFEQAELVFFDALEIDPSRGIPYWSRGASIPTYPPSYPGVAYNMVGIGSAMVSLHDDQSRFVEVLSSKYSVLFQTSATAEVSVPAMWQTGALPDFARSLTYKTDYANVNASPTQFGVLFSGELLPQVRLDATATYQLWGVDLSAVRALVAPLNLRRHLRSNTLDLHP